jgi:hypothetical protein
MMALFRALFFGPPIKIQILSYSKGENLMLKIISIIFLASVVATFADFCFEYFGVKLIGNKFGRILYKTFIMIFSFVLFSLVNNL